MNWKIAFAESNRIGATRISPANVGVANAELIELTVVIGLIGILLMFALADYRVAPVKAAVTEVLSLSTGARISVMEFRAVTGRWPTEGDRVTLSVGRPPTDSLGQFVEQAEIRPDGGLAFTMGDQYQEVAQTVVSLRPALSGESPTSTIVWLCGNAVAPPSFTAMARNETTTNPAFLPASCRDVHSL